ncbi:hypothetical protein PQE75_gp051 [Bacillus phage vB_BcoS-136]|uniref:Uncharacterized protein n=1 Tax=Bacillus phage vB_BcoS-136 TaxID=2419619 RepID=A0A3G3BVC0_9CAUD|nr:hypothetical protein PQE75_gp051 [Bacillus phage vB_BcoS-136]AYP68183.1 hypothetical protein vBBcoS136_00051 [Bacillus phage vB_BcoS-136]
MHSEVVIIDTILILYREDDNMKTKIRFGFKSKTQLPLFMVWREHLDNNNEVEFAEVIFKIG